MKLADELIARAEKREITFGIVGLGYVGLPLVVELARAGFKVLGYDISKRVVDGLNSGRSHIKDITDREVAELVARLRVVLSTLDGMQLPLLLGDDREAVREVYDRYWLATL